MKNILFSIIFITFFCGMSHCQEQIIKTEKGEYYKDKRLNNYLGNWEYSSGEVFFAIKLFASKIEGPNGLEMDVIRGCYVFKRSGNHEVKDSLDNCDSKKYSLIGNMESDQENILKMIYWDGDKRQKGTAKIEFIDKEELRIKWNLSQYDGEKVQVFEDESKRIYFGSDFPVPTDIEMVRVQ